jgi:cellulose synthase/poly-beta-1,6-N-acetylglucosamine synthase-like glycosyltransferase
VHWAARCRHAWQKIWRKIELLVLWADVARWLFFDGLLAELCKDILKQVCFDNSCAMDLHDYPLVSVLIAARNEEANIAACLDAICAQTYPAERMEIWVGNDQSEDGTAEIVMCYEKAYPNIHSLLIESQWKHLKGKANVLAQLAHKARGDYYFITDADVAVQPDWIKTMLASFTTGVGVITGVTAVEGKSLFARLQNAEWLFYTAHGDMNAKKDKPVTAMGNNMAVTKQAYWKTGGYENIPFSVTEDYELFKRVIKNGHTFKSVFLQGALAYTKPLPTFKALLYQRKRWFTGAFQLPLQFIIGLVILWSFLPFLLVVGYFLGWRIAASLLLIKWTADVYLLRKSYKTLGLNIDTAVWIYTPVSAICNAIFLLYQFMPAPVQWKGRKYEKPYDIGK